MQEPSHIITEQPSSSMASRIATVLAGSVLAILVLAPFLWWGAMLIGIRLSCPVR